MLTLSMLAATIGLAPCTHAQIVEERTTLHNGVYTTCGEGDGLNPCRDRNGETYEEEIRGPDIHSETNSEMAAEAAEIRNESPAELEATIRDLEEGNNL